MDLLVDVNGLYGVDKAYDSSDYNSRCDYAAPLRTRAAVSCMMGVVLQHADTHSALLRCSLQTRAFTLVPLASRTMPRWAWAPA